MKAMVVDGDFGLANLKAQERDVPKPGPGQIVIKMKAASLKLAPPKARRSSA